MNENNPLTIVAYLVIYLSFCAGFLAQIVAIGWVLSKLWGIFVTPWVERYRAWVKLQRRRRINLELASHGFQRTEE